MIQDLPFELVVVAVATDCAEVLANPPNMDGVVVVFVAGTAEDESITLNVVHCALALF